MRFGLWNEILNQPDEYPDYMAFTRAFHHAARAIAFAAKGDPDNARKAQSVFCERAKLVPKEDSLGNNSCETILGIMTPMVEGEILVAEGKIDDGIKQLRAAIDKEDALKSDRAARLVDSSSTFARRGPDEASAFCRSGTGLSRRSQALAGKRLVVIRTRGKFAQAKEKCGRSCSNAGEV